MGGLWLPKFIGTLWAIWKTRNGQVFRHIRATEEVFRTHIRDSRLQHSKFIEDDHPPMIPPPAPNYGHPPSFFTINLGSLPGANPKVVIQIDGSWDKSTGHGGAAWVATQRLIPLQSQGLFLLAASALRTETEACLSAIKWARALTLTNILILTNSTLLVTVLGSNSKDDISIHHTLNAIRAEAGRIQRC